MAITKYTQFVYVSRLTVSLSVKKMLVSKKNIIPLLALVLPLALTGLVQSSVYFFETLFLARSGTEVLEAGALVSWLLGTFDAVIFGLLSSVNVLIAYKFGEKNYSGIALVVRDGFWVALLLALPTMFLFWNIAPLFYFFNQNSSVLALAETYLHALTWGIPADFIRIALLEFLIGIGSTRIIILFSLFSVSCNIFFSFALIFGKFGFPMIGIAGAGWGITISNWVEVILLVVYLLYRPEYRIYFSRLFSFTKTNHILDILKIGLPMGLMYCVEVAFFFALTLLMGWQGSAHLIANQIALQYLTTLMAVVFSIAQAVTVRMGHLLGANRTAAARETAFGGLYISSIFMLFIGLIYCLLPEMLIALDLDISSANSEIIDLAKYFLFIAALFQLFEAVRITLFGALRALEDTRYTLIISLTGFWCVALPLGHFLAIFLEMHGAGYWWGMVAGALISVVLLYFRFKNQLLPEKADYKAELTISL